MLRFEERGKPECPEKILSEQGREPSTNSTHIWHRRWDLNPGHIGGRPVLSTRHHPCSSMWLSDTLFACTNTQAFKINVYSQLSLRRTPLGPALAVRLREMSVLQRVKYRELRKVGINSRCPFYRGVRPIELSVTRELTVQPKLY